MFIINLINLNSCLDVASDVSVVHFHNTEHCRAQENLWQKVDENT